MYTAWPALRSVCDEATSTTTHLPNVLPRSLVVSVLPVPAGPAGAPPRNMPRAFIFNAHTQRQQQRENDFLVFCSAWHVQASYRDPAADSYAQAGECAAASRAADAFSTKMTARCPSPYLRKCDVADVCQGCNDQALLHPQVLVAVLEVHITDGDDGGVLVVTPVKAHLLQPLKVSGVPDLCR